MALKPHKARTKKRAVLCFHGVIETFFRTLTGLSWINGCRRRELTSEQKPIALWVLVDERDQPRNNLLRRFLHQPMTFAFDNHSFDVRVCLPPTRFLSEATPRFAAAVALAQDAIDLADALGLNRFAVVGHDWGARAAYTIAALFPQRLSAVAALSLGYQPRGIFKVPDFEQSKRFWYQWLLCIDGGVEAVNKDPTCNQNSPALEFSCFRFWIVVLHRPNSLIKDPPPDAPVPPILPPRDGYLFLDKSKFRASFAGDVEAEKTAFMADSQVPWGLEALGGEISEPAWKSKPSWYRVN